MDIINLEEIKQQHKKLTELINSIIYKDLNNDETIINNCILLNDVIKINNRITYIIQYNILMKNPLKIHNTIKNFINNDLKDKPSDKLKYLVNYLQNKFIFETIYINNFDD